MLHNILQWAIYTEGFILIVYYETMSIFMQMFFALLYSVRFGGRSGIFCQALRL